MMTDDTLSINVDIDSMTLGEMEAVEEITGLGLDEIGVVMAQPGPKTKVLIALAFVVRRRTDPDVTVEQIRGMRIDLEDADPKGRTASDGPQPSPSPPVSLSLAATGS